MIKATVCPSVACENCNSRHPWLAANAEFNKESVIKTLSEIASKLLFTSLRCKLSYHLLFLAFVAKQLKKSILKLKF